MNQPQNISSKKSSKVLEFLKRLVILIVSIGIFFCFMYYGVGTFFHQTTNGGYKWIPLVALILIVEFANPGSLFSLPIILLNYLGIDIQTKFKRLQKRLKKKEK